MKKLYKLRNGLEVKPKPTNGTLAQMEVYEVLNEYKDEKNGFTWNIGDGLVILPRNLKNILTWVDGSYGDGYDVVGYYRPTIFQRIKAAITSLF